jgi:hypothetical protein
LRIGESRLPQAKLAIPVLERRALQFELLNLIPVPHASEMLESVEETKKKNQCAQPEQTVTFTTLLPIDLAP